MSAELQTQKFIGKHHFPLPEPIPGFGLFVLYKVSRAPLPFTTDFYGEHNGKWIDLFKVGEGVEISSLDQETLNQYELNTDFYRRKTIHRVDLVINDPVKAKQSIIDAVLSALVKYMPLQLGYEITSDGSKEKFVGYVLLIKETKKYKQAEIKRVVKQLGSKFTMIELEAKIFEPTVLIESLPRTVSWLNGM